MKKIFNKIISTLLCLSLMCIPVINVRAQYSLWTMTEDLTGYTSVSDLQDGWSSPRTGDTAEIGIDGANGGYRILQTSPKYLTEANKANGAFSPSIQRVFGLNLEDKTNGTVLKSGKLQGVYELEISYSAKVISKSSYNDVKLNPAFFTMYIGQVNEATSEIDSSSAAVNLRFNTSRIDITNNSLSANNTMSVKSVSYAEQSGEDHTVKITVNTEEQKVSVMLDGDTGKISEGDFMKPIDSFDGICIMAMERLAEDSYFRINKIELREAESENSAAVKNVLNSLPDKLADDPSNVTSDIDLPELGGVTWKSSNTAVISDSGTVTRQSSDRDVKITASVNLENNGGAYEKIYAMTVPALKEPENPNEPGSDGQLISFEEDFTNYTDINNHPRWGQVLCDLTSITASKTKGIEVMQIDTVPLVNGAVNGAQSTKLTYVIEGLIDSDETNRTKLRINKFSGQFKIALDFESYCPSVGKVDGVSITQPYYNVILGQAADVSNPASVTNNGIFMRMRSSDMTVLNSGSSSGNSMSPTSVTYDKSVTTHKVEVDFDTENKTAVVTIDGAAGSASSGPLLSADYLNAFSFSAMDRMKIGSYLRLKKIRVEQTAQNDRITKALNTLDSLPTALSADPYAVDSDIRLTENEYITWETSDSSVIEANGKVHRWFDDRDVVITAVYNDGGLRILKDYTMTVKALDISPQILLDETVTSDDGWSFEKLTSQNSGEYNVTSEGLQIKKITGYITEKPAYDLKSYAAYYRLFGAENGYGDSNSEVSSSGHRGVYDLDLKLKTDVSGSVPVYAEAGQYNGTALSAALGLRISKGGIDAVYDSDKGETTTSVFKGDTYDKTFDIKLRIDTVNKQGWIFVDGNLAASGLNLAGLNDNYFIDTLCISLDANNALNDSVTVNNIKLQEWERSEISSKRALLSVLGSLNTKSVTDNPDSVDKVNLPKTVNGVDIAWSCSSDLIDVDTGEVFHDENAEDVVLCATACSSDGIYVRREFMLTVRKAANDEEIVEHKLNNLGNVITAQDKDDIRYNLNLPTNYNGMQVEWSSSDENIINRNGIINRETAVTSPTKVSITAQVSISGKKIKKTFDYVVSPYAYEHVIYSGASIPEKIVANAKIRANTVTELVFGKNSGSADISFVDSDGKEAIKIAFDGDSYSFEHGDGTSDKYTIEPGKSEVVDVMVMPDIGRVAVWRNGSIIIDYCHVKDNISDFSGFSASGDALNLNNVTVKTDEYGVLDINKDNIDYFKPFEKSVIDSSVALVKDTIIPANVEWISSDPSVISADGVVTTPSVYRFIDMSLQLVSPRDENVKRAFKKTIAVACGRDSNIAYGASATVSTLEKDGFPITNLTDNDRTTVFGATGASRQAEITLDLGTERHINSLYLNENFDNYEKGIEKYEVYYSKDGKSWTMCKSGNITDLRSSLISFDTVYTRYLKFKIAECRTADVYINELEAYLFANAEELVRLDIDMIKLDVGYGVEKNVELPSKGVYGTLFTWTSDNDNVISSDGKLTKPERSTTVTLTVSAAYDGKTYNKSFSLYVPGKSFSGGGSGGGSGIGWSGPGEQIAPGFVNNGYSQDTQTPTASDNFKDVDKSHWAYDAIKTLKEAEIVNGDENGNFNPSSAVTREQFLKMLVLAAGIDVDTEADVSTDFADVKKGDWYAPFVLAGLNENLIQGVSDYEFGVGLNISRQDMAVMVMRMPDNAETGDESEIFDDDGQIAPYARDAVYAARNIGLIRGYENKFNPEDSLTRAEAAVVIEKLIDLIK